MASLVPVAFRRILVNEISHKFRDVCSTVTVKTPQLKPNEILVKNRFVGVNASDVNYSAGRYDPGLKPPFGAGFEGLGEIVDKGSDVKLPLQQAVGYMSYGAFTEYMVLNARHAFPLPDIKAEYLNLLVSGLTASISLELIGEMKAGEKVLITAAAGGTGLMAVQIAKNAGCHVIGTCSSAQKVEMLKSLGCDRVINYVEENLADVLKTEYPTGVDIVWESVGGETFDIGVKALARGGRLIVIGWISGYQSDKGFSRSRTLQSLPQRLLIKSQSVRGFFLFNHPQEIRKHMPKLIEMYSSGKLKCITDNGIRSDKGPFIGLESVYDAVDYLYTRKSIGKIVVELPNTTSKL